MRKQSRNLLPQMLLVLGGLAAYMPDGFAYGTYGGTVDQACYDFNGTQPYAAYQLTPEGIADKCTFCHQPAPEPKSTRKDPQWTWWLNQFTQITNFCPAQTNQAPDGVITSPKNNATFNVGTSVTFAGTGNDPDNNTPLAYAWDFGGGATNSSGQLDVKGNISTPVTFSKAGNFIVTFTVTDSLNRSDPVPAVINVTVIDPNANQAPNGTITSPATDTSIQVGETVSFAGLGTDPDGDSQLSYHWSFGGAANDSYEQKPQVKFDVAGTYTVMLTVTDSLGLSDPTPATRTITVRSAALACKDQDKDNFSPDGGVCGPVDCNDNNQAINPGAIEACGDNVDNDCNGNVDASDAQCKGSSCIGDLLNQVEIALAIWKQDDKELYVKGYWSTVGSVVKLSDALTGAVLGTTTVNADDGDKEKGHKQKGHEDDHEDEHQSGGQYEWKFELEHLKVVPCRVRVEIDGRHGEKDVAYAPGNCSGKPPATNKPPVANDDNVSTTEKVPVDIAVLANDTDADKDSLTIVIFTQSQHGSVTRNGEILTYTPKGGFKGSDNFTYTISDHHGGTAKATVTVNVVKAKSDDSHDKDRSKRK